MKHIIKLIVVQILISPVGFAQWVQTSGPEGGLVDLLVVNASTGHIFAGTHGGVYRSDNGGASWTWVNSGLPGNFQPTAMYSSGSNTYIYGASPLTTGTFYWSRDEGATWTQTSASGLPLLASIASLTGSQTGLLAGVWGLLGGSGIYRSTDNGASWTSTSNGLPADFYPGAFGTSGSNIFAGGHINATTKGVYLSTDDGAHWTAVNTNFPTTAGVTAFEAIGSTVFSATLTGGVLKTTDNGANWTKISPTSPVLIVGATALAATGTNLFIGGGGVVWKADAGGSGWTQVTNGLPAHDAGSSLNAMVLTGGNLLASCSKLGVWRSTDEGGNWSKSVSGLRALDTWGLLANGSTLYTSGVGTGFFSSTDNGDTWSERNVGVNLLNNGYYGFALSGGFLIGGSGIGPYRSTDQAATWQTPSPDLTGPVYMMLAEGGDVYASGQGLVAKSANNGANWSTLSTGFQQIQAVFSLWKNGATLLAGTSTGGIKRSTDNGDTWTAPVSGLPTTGGYGHFAQINTTLFVAHGGGVYRSTDDGATWSPANSGVLGAPAALHARGTDLFVGTNQGVYRSTDLGTSWTSISTGLPITPAVKILTSNDQYLFAGIDRNSVWRRPLAGITAVGESSPGIPSAFTLEQNYPNPFNPTTGIRYQVSGVSDVRLSVYDVLGREVAVLVNERKAAGSYQVEFDASGLASGMYVYRMTAGTTTLTKRMMLLK